MRRPAAPFVAVALLFAAVVGVIVLSRRDDGSRPASVGEEGTVAEAREAMLPATLFFGSEDGTALVSEVRAVPAGDEAKDEAVRRVFEELARGPEKGGVAVLPQGARLLRVFRDGEGSLVLDMNRALLDNSPGGSTSELLTVRALMETMAVNFPEVRAIQILIEGRIVESIAGHVAIDGPLRVRP